MSNQPVESRFSFSLRGLMIVVAVVAALLGLSSFSAGRALAAWMLLAVLQGVVPTIALVGVVYARGSCRAFSLGALVASLPVLLRDLNTVTYGPLGATLAVGSQFLLIGICGVAAVATRRWLIGRGLANDL